MKYLKLFEDQSVNDNVLVKEIKEWFNENYEDTFKQFSWGVDTFRFEKNKLLFEFGLTEPYYDGHELYNIQLNVSYLENMMTEDAKDELLEYINENFKDCLEDIDVDYEEINDAGNVSHNFTFTLYFEEEAFKEVTRSSNSGLWGMKNK